MPWKWAILYQKTFFFCSQNNVCSILWEFYLIRILSMNKSQHHSTKMLPIHTHFKRNQAFFNTFSDLINKLNICWGFTFVLNFLFSFILYANPHVKGIKIKTKHHHIFCMYIDYSSDHSVNCFYFYFPYIFCKWNSMREHIYDVAFFNKSLFYFVPSKFFVCYES